MKFTPRDLNPFTVHVMNHYQELDAIAVDLANAHAQGYNINSEWVQREVFQKHGMNLERCGSDDLEYIKHQVEKMI